MRQRNVKLFSFLWMFILLTGQTIGILAVQSLVVTDIEWNPGNNTVGRLYSNGTVQVVDRTTEAVLFEQVVVTPVTKLAWNPDGTRLAVGSSSNVLVWDVTNNQLEYTLQASSISSTFQSESGIVEETLVSLDWSSDNRLASLSRSGTLRIWNMANGQLVVNSAVPQATTISWKPNNANLITGSGLGLATIDPASGELSPWRVDGGLTDVVTAIQWNPDGSRIASGNVFGQVLVWDDTVTGHLPVLHNFDESTLITDIAWSHDGSHLATSSKDGTVRIYDTQTLKVIQSVTHAGSVFAVSWASDRLELAYAGENPETSLNIIQVPNACIFTVPATDTESPEKH